MKLNALERQFPVPYAHDFPSVRLGRKLEIIRQGGVLGTQGMIAAGFERLGKSSKHGFAVMFHHRRLAMHQSFRAHDVAAEVTDKALVSEADAKYRHLLRKHTDHRKRYTGIFGPPGTRPSE